MAYEQTKLLELVERAVNHRWSIPEFQRGFVWKPTQVRDLAESLWLDYPIGSLLVWNSGQQAEGKPGDRRDVTPVYFPIRHPETVSHLFPQADGSIQRGLRCVETVAADVCGFGSGVHPGRGGRYGARHGESFARSLVTARDHVVSPKRCNC